MANKSKKFFLVSREKNLLRSIFRLAAKKICLRKVNFDEEIWWQKQRYITNKMIVTKNNLIRVWPV